MSLKGVNERNERRKTNKKKIKKNEMAAISKFVRNKQQPDIQPFGSERNG